MHICLYHDITLMKINNFKNISATNLILNIYNFNIRRSNAFTSCNTITRLALHFYILS